MTSPNLEINIDDQESLGENNLGSQLTDPNITSKEIQVWTQNMEQKDNDRMMKM